MKNLLSILLLFLVEMQGFSQSSNYVYIDRKTPTLKVDKLGSVSTLQDLDPVFCRRLNLPLKEMCQLDNLLNRTRWFMVNVNGKYKIENPKINPQSYLQDDFDKMVTYESVAITATADGRLVTETGPNEKLTRRQSALIAKADPGTEITTRIRFRTISRESQTRQNAPMEGEFKWKVVSENEAVFPGGDKSLGDYFLKNVSAQIPASLLTDKTRNAFVSFTIDEEGSVINPTVQESSNDATIDQILLNAIRKMPKWSPASDKKGSWLKQRFRLEFGFAGC